MKLRTIPLVVRTTVILICCVLLVQVLNMAIFLICPPVPLGPLSFAKVQVAIMEGRDTKGIEIRQAEARDVRPQEAALTPLRDMVADRLGLPPERLRLELLGVSHWQHSARHLVGGGFDVGALDFAGGIKLARQMDDGSWRIVTSSASLLRGWLALALTWLIGSILVAIPSAFFVGRWLSRPIRQFAEAAERLGRNPREPDLEPDGPRELRGAALAFNEMKQRLGRYIDDRLDMMSAIAHDLRVPLTRLAFRLERAPDAIRTRAEADIAEMQRMLTAVLSFVQTTHVRRPRQRQELRSLLCSIADDMVETGRRVQVEEGPDVILQADDIGLRSLFTNLIHNAVTYGGAARIRLSRSADAAVVEIEDEGPGLPVEELERVFEPFYRGEPSRNRATGGIGLGLALVRSIAVAHGGSATLQNGTGFGLRATVTLPA